MALRPWLCSTRSPPLPRLTLNSRFFLSFCHLCRYVQAELVHARFAMLGAAGILVPDLFHAIGAGGPAAQIPWFDHAKFTYYADAHALFGVQMLLFFFVEMRRYGAQLALDTDYFSLRHCTCAASATGTVFNGNYTVLVVAA